MSNRARTLGATTAALLCLIALAAGGAGGQQSGTSGAGADNKAAGKAPAGQKGAPPARAGGTTGGTAATTPATPANAKGAKGAASPPAGAPPAGSTPAAPGGAPAIGAPAPDMGNIDQILEGDEEVLSGNAFTYDPGNRRDPFKSLLIAPDRPEFRGPRPEGVPGLLIDEIDLKGIFRTARGYVAQVNASNQKKSFLLKEGDQLYDGDVVSIGKNEVVFKQIVQDPTALKPFREVVKSLNPG
ncbi:MAG TPA: hypothetical protein VKY89_10610 [Thermoanaerobaculia bacterium]|nr:hypothetical protein [Thermoanaerobaculia bacterium]